MTTTATTLTVDQFRDAVTAAVRAPSMYNIQPWRFALCDRSIEVRIDNYRLLPVADPDRWGARIACGAAITNMRLALAVAGIDTDVHLARHADDDLLVATVAAAGPHTPTPRERALHAAIPVRRSNRRPFFDVEVPATARARMIAAADQAGASLMLTDDRQAVANIAEIVRDADERLRRDAAYLAEMQAWIGHHAVDLAGIAPEQAGLAPAGNDVLPMRDFGGPDRAPGRDYETDPLVGVLTHPGAWHHDDVLAGMALQAVLLTATDERLATSMLSQPIELPDMHERLRRAANRPGRPHMVIRIGFGQPGGGATRRPVEAVIDLPR